MTKKIIFEQDVKIFSTAKLNSITSWAIIENNMHFSKTSLLFKYDLIISYMVKSVYLDIYCSTDV